MKCRLFALSLCYVACMSSEGVRAQDRVVDRSLDLATMTESSGNYYVVFCARKSGSSGGVGHAFVVWGKEDSGKKLSSAQSFGFYPEPGSGAKAVFKTVS